MGLSSSQARLLSITARLTDNEYTSSQITNAKLRLMTQQTEAMEDYTRALNGEKYTYRNFDSEGNVVKTDFTMAAIYDYMPNKKQYAIKNVADKMLVSSREAKNFEETSGLVDFLERYDLIKRESYTYQKREMQPFVEHNPQYDKDWAKYNTDLENWYSTPEPPKNLEGTPGWTERIHTSELYKEVLKTGCMEDALANTNCYMHVLSSLLGPGEHTTTEGDTFTIHAGSCTEHGASWCWNTDQHPVSESLRNALKTIPCCNNDTEDEHEAYVDIMYKETLYKDVHTLEFECDDSSVGSVYQKLVNLLWEVHNDYIIGNNMGGFANPTHLAYFFHFIEFDLDKAELIPHPAIPGPENPDWKKWQDSKPIEPTTPENITVMKEVFVDETKERLLITDPEKAQWYTNIWYMMNGESDMIKIQQRDEETLVNDGSVHEEREWYLGTDAMKKNDSQYYQVVEGPLYSSKDWLSNSLNNGLLAMKQVNTSKNVSSKLSWQGIMFSNVSEVEASDNDRAIAEAQVNYEAKMAEINIKDEKYQRRLSLLDSEHHALQTEYDSVKSAYEKNVSRSFKAFQG